jgi:hypothetical protein
MGWFRNTGPFAPQLHIARNIKVTNRFPGYQGGHCVFVCVVTTVIQGAMVRASSHFHLAKTESGREV